MVKDSLANPLEGVIISLHPLGEKTYLNYTSSDQFGGFELVTNSKVDSLEIHFRMMSFKTDTLMVSNSSQEVFSALYESSEKLREVKLKTVPISQRGDTISYGVDGFKSSNDRVLSDVLKKMPGLEVDPNGVIRYQGKAINKYYVEGMDLLGGRYKLANENIPVDAVAKVQVLENHQPLKVLDSLVFSDQAAINIKLKKKNTWIGTMKLGLFYPIGGMMDATPMNFSSSRQDLFSLKANTLGENLSEETKVLTFDDLFNFKRNPLNHSSFSGIIPVSTPPFDPVLWNDNKSVLGSVNHLEKLTKDKQLRVNISAIRDQQDLSESTYTRIFTPDGEISLVEDKTNSLISKVLKGEINFELNSSKKYINNKLRFNLSDKDQLGYISEGNINQDYDSPYGSLFNDFQLVSRQGMKTQNFRSRIGYDSNQESLIVDGNSQEVHLERVFSDSQISWGNRKGRWSRNYKLGFASLYSALDSDLLNSEQGFTNNLKTNEFEPYVNPSLGYRADRFRMNFRFPLSYKLYQVDNDTENFLLFQPSLSFNFKINAKWEMRLSGGTSAKQGTISTLYDNYIMTNYRSIKRYDGVISETQNYRGSYKVEYKQLVKGFFAHLQYGYSQKHQNLIYNYNYNDQGGLDLEAVLFDNISTTQNLSAKLTKIFPRAGLFLSWSPRMSWSQIPQFFGQEYALVNYQNTASEFSIDYSGLSWVEWHIKYTPSKNKTSSTTSQSATILNQTLDSKLIFNPWENHALGVKYLGYFNAIDQVENSNHFLECFYRYKIPKSKFELEFYGYNLLGINSYSNISSSNTVFVENTLSLRPRQFGVKTSFSL